MYILCTQIDYGKNSLIMVLLADLDLLSSKAVRYNVLVNPTGLPGKFRGVDWVEESMINLYTKV
jgi:hypothetical protein